VITVYQDRYNKDLIFSIQHESNTVDSFIIKSSSGITTTTISNRGKKRIGDNSIIDQSPKKRDTLHDVNILIVDDEEDILTVFEYGLSAEGYDNIQTFSDPKKVIKHFVELKKPDYYDLAIIDIRMPFINGIQLHQILKIINPKMKVIFASALDAANELTSMYNIDNGDIIKKPTELKDLVNTINSALLKQYKINERSDK
jgi:response regulator RpfG family c-di-GMP phosphodiesterase